MEANLEELSREASLADGSQIVSDYEDDEDVQFSDLYGHKSKQINKFPDHGCRYCSESDESCVVKCGCGRWFCNGSAMSRKNNKSSNQIFDGPSHIVTHLVKARHREACLHANSPLGDSVLECYQCGSKNVFLLGFVPSKVDSVVVLLCREPCLHSASALKGQWDLQEWQPLIEEKRFLDWLVKVPITDAELPVSEDEESDHGGRKKIPRVFAAPSMEQIMALEKLWSSGQPEATMDDVRQNMRSEAALKALLEDDMLDCTHLQYEDAEEYMEIYSPLLEVEGESDRSVKEAQVQGNVEIRWELQKDEDDDEDAIQTDNLSATNPGKPGNTNSIKTRHLAWFFFPRESHESKLMPGDELKLTLNDWPYKGVSWLGVGNVIKIKSSSEEVCLEVRQAALSASSSTVAALNNTSLKGTFGSTGSLSVAPVVKSTNKQGAKPAQSSDTGAQQQDLVQATKLYPDQTSTGFKVAYVWKSTSFDRMGTALKMFARDPKCVSKPIHDALLGRPDLEALNDPVGMDETGLRIPPDLSAPNLPRLNHSQESAIRRALSTPLSLIQGPPGTGKTLTSATTVYQMIAGGAKRVLVCSPSNIAVDHLAAKIAVTGLRVVRIAAKSREDISSPVDNLCLHVLTKQLCNAEVAEIQQDKSGKKKKSFLGSLSFGGGVYAELGRLLDKREVSGLSEAEDRKMKELRLKTEFDILSRADVICVTCVGAGDPRLRRFDFPIVLVDETTQAMEPEVLVPLVKGAKHVVLVGDHCQLGPVVVCKAAAKAGLKISLFERLIAVGVRPQRLEVQYRMHPTLSEFPSAAFYEGSLQNGISAEDRIVENAGFFNVEKPNNLPTYLRGASVLPNFPWPNPKAPVFFYNSFGKEEISSSGTSYLNRAEAGNIERVVVSMLLSGIAASQIGIITPYEGQRAHVQSVLQRSLIGMTSEHGSINLSEEIEIASVDAFQGREKDFVIMSCVRANRAGGIGFLTDPRRLNVALTRAKYGLVICGSAHTLLTSQSGPSEPGNINSYGNHRSHKVWHQLLSHLKKRALILEGPLNSLRQSQVVIPGEKPEKRGNLKSITTKPTSDAKRVPASPSVRSSSGWTDFEVASHR